MNTAVLDREVAKLRAPGMKPRPWHYGELHNPWSRAAEIFDAWAILDLCQSPAIIASVTQELGGEVILFDSELAPSPWTDGSDYGPHQFPVRPCDGVTIVVPLAGAKGRVKVVGNDTMELEAGKIIAMEAARQFEIESSGGGPVAFLARYFPATSRYLRDPAAPEHQALTDRNPLFNTTTAPLWLVTGEDKADNDFVTGFNLKPGHWL